MTKLHSLMSKPLAATSVAINTGDLPDLNEFITQSRSRWSLSPWITAAKLPTARPNWSHIFFVEQKISAFSGCGHGGLFKMSINRFCFSKPVKISIFCVMSLFATNWSVSPMFTWTGLVKIAVATRMTAFGHVAVKNNVWRWLGTFCKIFLICGSKPISNIRSASSRTT